MSQDESQLTGRGQRRKGLGSIVVNMLSLWMDPASGPTDADDLPRRVGPVVLTVWTLLGIGLGQRFPLSRLLAAAARTWYGSSPRRRT
jgi:hypothetical protein